MRTLIDILVGGDVHEALAKSGLAGALSGAFINKTLPVLDKIAHVVTGVLASVYLGGGAISILKTYFHLKMEDPVAWLVVGYSMGYFGLKSITLFLEKIKLDNFLTNILKLWLNKKNEQ